MYTYIDIHIYIDTRLVEKLKFVLEILFRITLLRGMYCLPLSIPPHILKTYTMYFLQETKLGTLNFSFEGLKTNMNHVICSPSFADSSIIY